MAEKPDKKLWSGAGQLMFKERGLLTGKNILVTFWPGDELDVFADVAEERGVTFFNCDYRNHGETENFIKESGLPRARAVFGTWYESPALHDLAVIMLPKGKGLFSLALAMVRGALSPLGRVIVVGDNTSGIKSVKKLIEKEIGPVESSAIGRHATLFVAKNNSKGAARTLSSFFSSYSFEFRGKKFVVENLPGVFSFGKLDAGTKILLETLPETLSGRILDLGAGSGVVGTVIKKLFPETEVEMTDVNALAVASSEKTAEKNGAAIKKIVAGEGFSETQGKYDLIISNPPFHEGFGTSYEIPRRLIKEARNHLRPGGSIRIVGSPFLTYEKILAETFGNCRVLAETPSYCVYESRLANKSR